MAYVILATICWGSLFVLLKTLLVSLPPIPIAATRFLLGGLVFAVSGFIENRKTALRLTRSDFLALIFLVILPLDLSALTLLWGLGLTTATKSGFIGQMSTVFLAGLSFTFLRERLHMTKLAALFLAFIGATLMIVGNDPLSLFTSEYGQGDLLVLFSSGFWALYLFGLRRFLHGYSTSTIGGVTFLLGGIVMIPFALPSFTPVLLARFDALVSGILLLSSLVTINAGNFFYYRAIRALDLSLVATISNLTPVVSTLLAFAIFHELDILNPRIFLGGVLIMIGMLLAGTSRLK